MINGCIFDLDGVIVNTTKYHYMSWKQLAYQLGFDFTIAENEVLKGLSREKSLDILLKIGGYKDRFSDEEKVHLMERKNRWYIEMIKYISSDDLIPGVIDFIDDLKKNEIKLAIGSSSKNAKLVLDKLGISDKFDAIIDGSMIKNAKPDPELFVKCKEALELDKDSCIVFEDAQAGINAAKCAGMRCVAIGDSSILKGADMVIGDFSNFTYSKLTLL